MSKKKLLAKGLVALSLFTQHFAWAQNANKVERPPQFVMFAFDGSYNNDVWQYARDFSKHEKQMGVDSRFTFFINPVYFLNSENKSVYHPPGYRLETRSGGEVVKVRNMGSAIGWGDSVEDIDKRLEQMNEAYLEGHEIGSHAVGHFDAGYKECQMNKITRKCERDANNNIVWKWDLRWTESEWKSEFDQFFSIMDNVFTLNKLRPNTRYGQNGLLFRNDIKGFRAPVLGVSDGLWPNLPKFGIQYDTSKTNFENYWPTRNQYGTWDFPLAEVMEPGGARRWISMDFNFCVRDSARVLSEEPQTMQMTKWSDKKQAVVKANGARDCLNEVSPEQKKKVKENMLAIYRSYFNNNYYGNRAPVHIGHHFSRWLSGAYFEAFFEFANEVCSKPEVKCGTYAELMNFMNSKSAGELDAYRKGNFPKMVRPKSALAARHWDLNINMSAQGDAMKFALAGRDAQRMGLKKVVTVEGVRKEIDGELNLSEIRQIVKAGDEASVRIAVQDRMGKEVATATYRIDNVGTAQETVHTENIEERWLQGHLPEAHKDEVDFTRGH